MSVSSMMLPVSVKSTMPSHHITLSSLNRNSRTTSDAQAAMNLHNVSMLSAVRPLGSPNERPVSKVVSAPTLVPFIPAEHYYVWTQPSAVYQPQVTVSAPVTNVVDSSSVSQSSSVVPLDGSPTVNEQDKLKQRLARKAELARMSRRRKKATLGEMHERFEFLQRENESLKESLAQAREALAKAQSNKCSCAEHDGDAPDLGLLIKRDETPALSELSPVSSPFSVASDLPRIPSALDLSKTSSEGVINPFISSRSIGHFRSSSLRFNGKSSAFSMFKSSSSPVQVIPRPSSSLSRLSSSSSSSEADNNDDCHSAESTNKKQRTQ